MMNEPEKKPITMSEAGKCTRRLYMQKWRARNREHLREYAVRYWERQAENEREEEQHA